MTKFPKVLHVKWEDGGTGPAYLGAYANPMDAAQLGVNIKMGVYRLEGVQEVRGVIETRKTVAQR